MSFSIDILAAFERTPAPLDFVLPGLLAGTVGAIVSPGGAGKSMLAMELAVLVATGHDMAGFAQGETYPTGQVGFLAAEDPPEALCHRLHAIGGKLSPSLRTGVAEGLSIEALLGESVDIFDPKWASHVEHFCENKRLVFLDTLRRFHRLDENSSGDMAQLLSVLEGIGRRTSSTLVFLHHANKSAALNGQGDMQQASRGSSVLVDNIRWQMYLAGMTREEAKAQEVDDERRGYFVRAGISKQNYGQPYQELWLMRANGGVMEPAHLGTTSVVASKKVQAKRQAAAAKTVANVTAQETDDEPW